MRLEIQGKYKAEYSFVQQGLKPIDVFKEYKKSGAISLASTGEMVVNTPIASDVPGTGLQIPLDLKTWLPFAAPTYHISADPKDHIIVPCIIMPADLPNRNGVAFPLRELIKWDPEVGRQAYKTWKGMPTYSEHDNEDYTKARGVIADSVMRKLKGFNRDSIWKVILLLTFDRSKYPDVTNRILSGETNSYSMGAWVNSYECSFCNAELGKCNHINKKRPSEMNIVGQNVEIACRNAIGIRGFETSEVATPAYISAISDSVSELV